MSVPSGTAAGVRNLAGMVIRVFPCSRPDYRGKQVDRYIAEVGMRFIMPKATTMQPMPRRPNLHRSTSQSRHSYNNAFVERMVQQTASYITAFDEHSKVIRSRQKEQVAEAYHCLVEQGLVLPADGTRRTTLSMQDQESMEKKFRLLPKQTLKEYIISYYFIAQAN